MNYLNLHTDFLRSEDYLGSDPVVRATWLNLMAWCATQENGGTIENATEWSDRKWQQIIGVTLAEVQTASELYHFTEGGSLVVRHYPKDKEEEVKTNRENGKKGGRPRKETQNKPGGFESVNPDETGGVEIAETERNGMEGEREGKGNGITPPSPPRGKRKTIKRPRVEEVVEYISPKLKEINPDWTDETAKKAIELKFETFVSDGWKDGNGKEIKNWKIKFQNCLKFERPWNYGQVNNQNSRNGNTYSGRTNGHSKPSTEEDWSTDGLKTA